MVWHERLSVRLLAPILGALVLSLGGSLAWVADREEHRLMDSGREQAALVNDVIKTSLRHQMLRSSENAIQDTLGRLGRQTELAEISLIDQAGVVRYSSDPARVGAHMSRASVACASCHAGTAALPALGSMSVEGADGRRFLRTMSLVKNEPACHVCHGEQDGHLGLLLLDVDVEPSLAAVANDRRALLGVGAGTLAIVVALIAVIVWFLVQRPVNALVKGTRRIRQRDLDTHIDVGVRGEIGELATAFNAMVVDTKSYVDDIQRKQDELATLYSFVERVSRSIDLRTLRRIVADLLVESFPGARFGAILLKGPTGDVLGATVRRSDGEATDIAAESLRGEWGLDEVVDGAVLDRWLGGATKEPEAFAGGLAHAIPLRTGDEDVGVLVAGWAEGAPITPAEPHLLQALASHVAVAVQNARLYTLAVTDDLTGLYAVRFFRGALAREVERAQRYGRKLSLLMLDTDNFKRVNDVHGHPAGDRCLREVAAALGRSVRNCDVACRYGGDEFVVLLPETDAPSALVVAERIRAQVQAATLVSDRGPVAVTVSVGIASFPTDATTAAGLLEAADAAMYAAKQAGRNRVVCADRAPMLCNATPR